MFFYTFGEVSTSAITKAMTIIQSGMKGRTFPQPFQNPSPIARNTIQEAPPIIGTSPSSIEQPP